MKKWLIVGAITAAIGLIIAFGSFRALDGDLTKLSTSPQFEKKEKIVENLNQSISIEDDNMPFVIDKSPDDDIHFIYYENEKETYSISDLNGISFEKKTDYKWSDFIQFDLQSTSFTLLLPSEYLGNIEIKTSNGSVEMKDTQADRVFIKTDNSTCVFENVKANNLTAVTNNGKVIINSSSVQEICDLSSSNGKITADSVSAAELVAKTSNAGIELTATNINGNIKLNTSNGGIHLNDLCFKGDIVAKTSNGPISGNVLAMMSDFSITSKTSNGSNNLPEQATMGSQKLDVKTSNGSISISFEE